MAPGEELAGGTSAGMGNVHWLGTGQTAGGAGFGEALAVIISSSA